MKTEETGIRGKNNGRFALSSFVWMLLLSGAQSLVFIQAYRDVLIAPRIEELIKPLIYTILFGPVAAAIVVRLLKAPASILFGAVVSAAGCALAMSKTMNVFLIGECLMFAGAYIYFIALIWFIGGRLSGGAGPGAAAVAIGILAAAVTNMFLRRVGAGVAAFGFASLILAYFAFRRARGMPPLPAERGAGPALKPFSLLLIGIPIHFIFYVFGKPEILASRCMASYGVTTVAVAAGLAAACVIALLWESAREGGRKALGFVLLIGNIAAAAYFYSLYSIPRAGWQLGAVALAAAVVGIDLYRIIAYAASRRSAWLVPAAALAMFSAAFGTVGLDYVVLLENHLPEFHGWLLVPLAAFALLTAPAVLLKGDEKPWKSVPAVWMAGLALFIPAAGLAFSVGLNPESPKVKVDPLVFASLYTWYGTPDGTFGGTYFGIDFKKEGAQDDFVTETANMPAVMAGGGGSGLYGISGRSDGKTMNSFTVGFDFPAALIAATPSFVTIAYELSRTPNKLLLEITAGGKTYSAEMPKNTKMAPVRLEWPGWFNEKTAAANLPEGTAHLSITLRGGDPEQYSLLIDYVRFSRWAHYNEDYHAYYDKEKKLWFNDPPRTLATAHHASYSGKPWPEIKPYSPHGYYDSLDTDVMTSQLQLMAKAGIDVVLFMHPPFLGVIRQGMDIIKKNKLPLRVAWYYCDGDEQSLIRDIAPLASDPVFLKVGGRPVVVFGQTGMRELPPARYAEELGRLRRAGIFVVGDNYMPPKEEMLNLMDGHYYYDTSGMYRARWGSRKIGVAQPDGTFVTGHGHLSTVFDATSRITHAHRGVFLATVIPGCDNLSVHGFEGTPLYDTRPGTVIRRDNGATYAETWRAAIAARADWICIVSWNELHEGTEIEPTMEDGVKYVELTRKWSDLFHRLKR
jgi:hypothetical protein